MRGRNNRNSPGFVKVESQQATQQEDKEVSPTKIPDFSLTQNQFLMIMSKLPKGFSLQPVRNMQRSRKLLSQLTDKPLKTKYRQEKSQEKEHSDQLVRESSKMTIRSDESAESDELSKLKIVGSTEPRKSERIFLREKVVYYDLEKESQQGCPQLLQTQAHLSTIPDTQNQETVNPFVPTEIEVVAISAQQKLLQASGSELRQASGSADSLQKPLDNEETFKTHQQIMSCNLNRSVTRKQQSSPSLRQVKSQEKPSIPVLSQADYKQKFSKEWQILKSLQRHSMIDPFTSPVDEKRDCAPNYYKIVQKPMDLATIEDKLKQQLYKDKSQFDEDVNQMWKNSHLYNKPGSAMVRLTVQLEKYYQNLKEGRKLKKDTSQIKRGRKR